MQALCGACGRRGQVEVKEEPARRQAPQRNADGARAARLARLELERQTRPNPREINTTFLSHHKMQGVGTVAGQLKQTLDKEFPEEAGAPLPREESVTSPRGHLHLRTASSRRNFLDVEHLNTIDSESLIRMVRGTEVLVLLLSAEVMHRPWILVEIHTALSHGVPIVPVQLQHHDFGWRGGAKADEPAQPNLPPRWPDDAELRELCHDSGLESWLASLPVHPPDKVDAHNAALRSRLSSYKMLRYDSEAEEEVRRAMDSVLVRRIKEATEADPPPAVGAHCRKRYNSQFLAGLHCSHRSALLLQSSQSPTKPATASAARASTAANRWRRAFSAAPRPVPSSSRP